MEFSPFNPVVQRCLEGMTMEDAGNTAEAGKLFLQAWNEAKNDFEKFLAAYYVSRHQQTVNDRLEWLETALAHAANVNDETVRSAFPALYSGIAGCYEELSDKEKSKKYAERAKWYKANPSDKGPFFHGTKADLQPGDLLSAGGYSNYKSDLKMNHIYFTAMANGAGLAAALAKGNGPERVYLVEPTGDFENDPNVTDKKFPGNPTRSYRSAAPLKVVREIKDWVRPGPEALQRFRQKLADNKGEIIN